MEMKHSRLVNGVEFFYKIVKGSIYFWITLIKKGLVYGILPAISDGLTYVSTNQNVEEKFFTLIKKKRDPLPFERIVSLSWFFIGSFISAFFLLSNGTENQMIQVFEIVSFLVIFLSIIYLCWTAWLVNKNPTTKYIYALALDQMIRHPFKSLYIAGFLVTSVLVAWVNLIIFFFVIPGLFLWLVDKGLGMGNIETTMTVNK